MNKSPRSSKVLYWSQLAKALEEILPQTQAGDTILLSPACASWDQYKTFEERGDLFIQAFENLKK
ncbi:hypothetical protein ACI3RH_09260 [Lactococcus lactis]